MRFPLRVALFASLLALATNGLGGAQAAAPKPVGEWNPSGRAVAIAAEVTSEGPRTRLLFTLSKAVDPHAFVMERPDRAIIDLPEVNFQLPADAGRHRVGLVSSFRYGLFASGRSRIVIDLAQPALIGEVSVTTRKLDNAVLLSVELVRAEREVFSRKAAAETVPVRAASPVVPAAAADRRPVIAIDAGHGGLDPGARAGELLEKDIVFGFAQDLRKKLETSGRYRIVMTRDADVFIPLDERVKRARAAKADLFISIHADTIATHQVRGATVYTGSEQASDDESANVAERENSADQQAGFKGPEQPEEVADILQDLTLRETRGFSQRFAGQLIQGLTPVTRLNVRPHRQAGFRVLRAYDIPSVLLELGYLSSQQDLSLLTSESWREKATGAMATAIERFFATRLANGSTAVVSP